jgi:hypothetical protein
MSRFFGFTLLFLVCVGFTLNLNAQEISTEEMAVNAAQAQLEAYNRKDLEAFLAVFHEDAAIYNLGSCEPTAQGKEKLREVYGNLFKSSPNLHSNVINRSVVGNKVFDYELITGRANSDEMYYLMAIYEVVDGKIKNCYFVRK